MSDFDRLSAKQPSKSSVAQGTDVRKLLDHILKVNLPAKVIYYSNPHPDQQSEFTNRMQFHRIWADDSTFPKVTILAFEILNQLSTVPYFLLITGEYDDMINYDNSPKHDEYRRLNPNMSPPTSSQNYAPPGYTLRPNSYFREFINDIHIGKYKLSDVIALKGPTVGS